MDEREKRDAEINKALEAVDRLIKNEKFSPINSFEFSKTGEEVPKDGNTMADGDNIDDIVNMVKAQGLAVI